VHIDLISLVLGLVAGGFFTALGKKLLECFWQKTEDKFIEKKKLKMPFMGCVAGIKKGKLR